MEDKKDKLSLRDRWRPRELRPALRWTLTVGLLICAALGLHLLCQMVGTLDFSRGRFSSYFHHPVIFLLNLLPVVLVMAFVYFATNRAWLSFLISSVLLLLMEFINYFKIVLRGDPFVAEDFFTINEGAGMLGQLELHFPPLFFIALVLILIGTLVLLRYARGRVPKRLWWVRVIGLAACIGFGALSWGLLYSNVNLYEKQLNYYFFDGTREAEYRASHGFFWSFFRSIDESLPEKPAGYSDAYAEELLSPYEDAAIPAAQKVNVVITMLESYSDLSEFDTIDFTRDAYSELHALQEEAYHGTLISDTLGGGTVNAERSLLTGFTYPQPRYRRNTQSFVRYFSEQGYVTEGAHPGFDWFYSRKVINERLGFDDYDFMEGHYDALITENNTYNEHPNDALFFEDRIQAYANRDASQPYFSFSISYQNHCPYEEERLTGEEYVARGELSESAYYIVNNYLSGVADTGRQMASYIDSFRDDETPVVLVFFGDHKPTLGASNVYYEELGINAQEGSPEGFRNLYTTPYLIWANDAAKAVLGKSFTGLGRTISPCYLMAEIFDCCGWIGPAWMQYQRQARETLPVLQSRGMYLVDHTDRVPLFGTELTEAQQAALKEQNIVEYYVRRQKPD